MEITIPVDSVYICGTQFSEGVRKTKLEIECTEFDLYESLDREKVKEYFDFKE
jgi:hypothetical protein